FEQGAAWAPKVNFLSEPITGLTLPVPPVSGLVLTTLKENELVEVPIVSPLPAGQVNPVLAHWTYGLGRSVAFTSDAGRRWAKTWPDWDSYAAFWSQVVRWSMRPVDPGNLTLTVRRDQGRIRVVVDALDKDNQFLNFLQIRGNVVSPDLKGEGVELVQTAPGKYEATYEAADSSGNYFVNLGYRGAGGVQGVISSGISVPYSDEYRELRSNPAILETIAGLTDGVSNFFKMYPDGRPDLRRTVDGADHFRRDPRLVNPSGFSDLWPNLLWLAAVLFLADVAVRRIAPDVDRIRKAVADHWQKLRGREVAPAPEYMEKLRSRKAEVGEQIDRSRAATRFEAPPPSDTSLPLNEPLFDPYAPPSAGPPQSRKATGDAPGLAPTGPKADQPESYTNRLLRAKQKVWEDREKEKDKGTPS
ncbi:MAG: glutamine amidotransferase, partial [Planctomycetia bacterium]|nr:glutamine amidotransferase [Planctomycetia bacterium]